MGVLRKSTRTITRPVRRLYLSRQKHVREYISDEKIVIQLSAAVDLKKNPWIDAAIAFTQSPLEIVIKEPIPTSGRALLMNDYVDYYRDLKSRAVLILGENPEKEQIDALKLLQIPYRVVSHLNPPQKVASFPEDNPKRAKWIKAIDRRHVIYAHMDRLDNLGRVLDAVRSARRSFPDLLLIIGGIRAKDIPYTLYGFSFGHETDDLKNLNYFDILHLSSPHFQPLISSISTVQLITPCRKMREIATQAINNCTAVAFYDVRPQSLGTLNELVDSGTIWSIRKRDSLSSALTQVLDFDASANSATQSITRLSQGKNDLIDALDALIATERAA